MNFPNAHNGVKKIFTAEILSLIGTIALVVAAILALTAGGMISTGAADQAVGETTGIVAGAGLFGLVGSILMIVAFILNLVGIVSAKKDEGSFSTALTFVIVGIAASILAGLFTKNAMISDLTQIITDFAEMMVAYYVVQGIANLAVRLNDSAMAERGNKVRTYLMIAYCLPILVNFISMLFSMKEKNIVAEVLGLAALILSLVVYFIYLGYLSKAKRMLEG